MAVELIHDLSAAYALNALDAQGRRFYERHLAHCPQCQADVADFSRTAAALAYAAPSADPPMRMRRLILAAARAESSQGSGKGRWIAPRASTIAAVAACAAIISVVIWTRTMHSQVQSMPTRQTLALTGANGTVVRSSNGEATMTILGLHAAPAGKRYEVWVIRDGAAAIPAGLFLASGQTTIVHLTERVPKGARVGVTVESPSGASRLVRPPLFTSAQA